MRALLVSAFAFGAALAAADARAETISQALARAYLGNPMLNRDRAATRVADEGVSKAEAGYRPRIVGSPYLGIDDENVVGRRTADLARSGFEIPKQGTLTVTETLFNGNRTTNEVRRAVSRDLGSREALRETEQETLLTGATAYMDVLRDVALLALARSEITVLEYELRGARARYRVSEVTFTDVAQVSTSLARGRTAFFRAQAALETSMAVYRRVIGAPPTRIEAARPIDAILPSTREAAIALALTEHPRIVQALHEVDAARTLVQVRESELYPTVDLVGLARIDEQVRDVENRRRNLEATARVRAPLYTGGTTYAAVRQAKEEVSTAEHKAASIREQVRASVASTWGQIGAAKALIISSKAAVQASEVALVDVRAEASLGQRTTYDVLLAIQTLFSARASLIAAQRDRVVDTYELAAAAGRLSATSLSLAVTPYDPTIHFAQVKDKWFGLRTPDGR